MTIQERLTTLPPLDRKVIRRLAVLIVGLIAVIFGIFFWYNATHLRLVSTEPGNNKQASQLTWVKFSFNKPIGNDSGKNLTVSPATQGRVEVINKDLFFYPSEETFFKLDTTYTVTLSEVHTLDGTHSLSNITLTFRTTSDGALPSARDKDLVEKTDVKEQQQPVFDGVEAFLTYGVTSDQVANLQTKLRLFKPAAKRFAISTSTISTNSEPGNFSADFNLIIDKSSYSAHMDYSGLDDIILTLTDTSGKLVYNSATATTQ